MGINLLIINLNCMELKKNRMSLEILKKFINILEVRR